MSCVWLHGRRGVRTLPTGKEQRGCTGNAKRMRLFGLFRIYWCNNWNIACIVYDTTYKYDRMIKVEVISNKSHKRILKCQEGKRVWYQIWIPNLDMNCIERYFKGYNEVKRWWLPNLQLWYVFFYEKKGGKVRGVLGKDRTKDLIRSIL